MFSLLTKRIRISENFLQLILGLGALLFGLMGYMLSRPVDSTYLGSMISSFFRSLPFRINNYGIIGGVLPEFLHPFALALITMAIFPQASRKVRAMICLFWLVVDLFFEIGQCFGRQIAQSMTKILPQGGVSEILINYFVNGTYDNVDIFAIWVGIISAFIISELLVKKGGKGDETQIFNQRRANMFKTPNQGAILETGG